eukprot:g16262.t1
MAVATQVPLQHVHGGEWRTVENVVCLFETTRSRNHQLFVFAQEGKGDASSSDPVKIYEWVCPAPTTMKMVARERELAIGLIKGVKKTTHETALLLCAV